MIAQIWHVEGRVFQENQKMIATTRANKNKTQRKKKGRGMNFFHRPTSTTRGGERKEKNE